MPLHEPILSGPPQAAPTAQPAQPAPIAQPAAGQAGPQPGPPEQQVGAEGQIAEDPPTQPGGPQPRVEVSDQDMEQWFQIIMDNIERKIFEERTDPILDRLDKADDIAQTLGDITFELVSEQLEAVTQAGKEQSFPEKDILMSIGTEVVNDLTQLAVSSGVWDVKSEEEAQQLQGEALMYAAEKYAEFTTADESYTQDDIQSLLEQAEADGGNQPGK